mmetsp:Transcript_13059/g.28104  ORF Transcript_13059/g.28104 Transcript_13059/m.28104 type:complete len:217 (-) Transcript_13059:334-984(-)
MAARSHARFSSCTVRSASSCLTWTEARHTPAASRCCIMSFLVSGVVKVRGLRTDAIRRIVALISSARRSTCSKTIAQSTRDNTSIASVSEDCPTSTSASTRAERAAFSSMCSAGGTPSQWSWKTWVTSSEGWVNPSSPWTSCETRPTIFLSLTDTTPVQCVSLSEYVRRTLPSCSCSCRSQNCSSSYALCRPTSTGLPNASLSSEETHRSYSALSP